MNKLSLLLFSTLIFSNPSLFAMEDECTPLDTFNGSEQCVYICPFPDCRETCPPMIYCENEIVLSGSDSVALQHEKFYRSYNDQFKNYLNERKKPSADFEKAVKEAHDEVMIATGLFTSGRKDLYADIMGRKKIAKSIDHNDYQQLINAYHNLLEAIKEARR